MRHAIDHRKLGRNPSHRKAMLRNLMNSLIHSERIETTVARAKELRRIADRLITLGKRNTTHARRHVFSLLSDKENTEKLFSGLAGRFSDRAGGYTRIVRTGFRSGDGAEMALLEYLPVEEKKAGARKGRKKKPVLGKEKAAAKGKAVKAAAGKKKAAKASPGKPEGEESPRRKASKKKKPEAENP
ncbi:MAG: 50S ribosomal protein L17 [Deltaproteobacteria bacterium RBG_19FT_COMBO_60_16]|nr:MAG: 50S ribosomal protein L17 [Deltaproteobacteria bacterium RBG_16_64_85]OGP99843.1 MAG: 50S ribosomal protein L17 [Deltaproteobacteria bacterium RBG_19FT_COMBO_60_16]